MSTGQIPVKLIKSLVGCDIDENNLISSFSEELADDEKTRKRVRKYISHAKSFRGLTTKFASNFHVSQITALLSAPGAAFLRFYLASDEDTQGNVTGTVMLMTVTDEHGKVINTDRSEAITVGEECCGNPPGNERFKDDPFLGEV